MLLRSGIFTSEELQAIARDYRHAGLEPAEVAMMAFAEKIAGHASTVVPDDLEGLRRHGFSVTPTSWTSPWRRPPAVSSARSSTASAPRPTTPS